MIMKTSQLTITLQLALGSLERARGYGVKSIPHWASIVRSPFLIDALVIVVDKNYRIGTALHH